MDDDLKKLQRLIQVQPATGALPGIYDTASRLVKRFSEVEEKMIQVFAERRGIELPKDAKSLTLQSAVIRSLRIMRESVVHSPSFTEERVIERAWCVDIRENPHETALTFPRVEMRAKDTTFYITILDDAATPGLWDEFEESAT